MFVPVTFEFVTICDICDQNVTKSVFLKKPKKTRACDQGHKFEIVTFCDSHRYHTLSVTGTKPVSVSVWNPDRNVSYCPPENCLQTVPVTIVQRNSLLAMRLRAEPTTIPHEQITDQPTERTET
jgi:hypothetical protein